MPGLPVVSSHGSKALPGYAYGDPAKIVEAQELRAMGCAACVHSETIFAIAVCRKSLKFPACRQDRKNGYKLRPEAGG